MANQILHSIDEIPHLSEKPLKRAFVLNTGCIRRALDTTKIYHYLMANGWSFTNNISAAHLVIVTTCSAVGRSEELSVIALKKVARNISKDTKLIIAGCLPKVNPDKIRSVPGLGPFEFVPTRSLEKFDSVLNSTVKFDDLPDANMVTNELGLMDYVLAYRLFRNSAFVGLYKKLSPSHLFLRSIIYLSESLNKLKQNVGLPAREKIVPYYNIRIAEGCAFACSFCCIRFATGRVSSKPIDEIEQEFKRGVAQGHRIIQLVCEDVGCYGIDIKKTFPQLLRRLLSVEGDYQIVMIDFGGYWLVKYYDELRELFLMHPEKIRELYVAIQSGSNNILKSMKRPERIEDVKYKLRELKREMPHLILRTTVIIGFPGESEEDFRETIQAIREIDFAAVELNRYEDRPGTVSSMKENKVPPEVIERRIKEIRQYC